MCKRFLLWNQAGHCIIQWYLQGMFNDLDMITSKTDLLIYKGTFK